jgi:hypothetical protein
MLDEKITRVLDPDQSGMPARPAQPVHAVDIG